MIINGAANARTRLILTHGSGSDINSIFMQKMAENIANQVQLDGGFNVVRFNFPYMDSIIKSGKKRPPDRAEKLIESFKKIIHQQTEDGAERVFIGGKSMGGRIASMLSDSEALIKGLICLGYPFHPPGKPDKLRTEHLYQLQTPCLICQGERDRFGTKTEISGYKLPDKIQFSWMTDGDHSFIPFKKSAVTESDNLNHASKEVAQFITGLCG
ncbi:MAG: alpha/beta hydrolase [Gammaproteobacteria bacterium]|jgi:hypothetical protein|nr:alpha/beta hydrolase [Gammaproteobacteria bacterium]MBT3723427.1 alpha/beta hydrolase [Gammaproteobacteria bacterium]MBT4077668.1 alpha/beta hydrolase [Gammaproteobacteria bacterium]MBT4196327.1 alpha/beta hydrolase [Gammaproteobacteria bacterium]MBT4452411.1 alpha/beta hydrolase [Gammaproteobacteria bacterium]